jgi:hypothetical protein
VRSSHAGIPVGPERSGCRRRGTSHTVRESAVVGTVEHDNRRIGDRVRGARRTEFRDQLRIEEAAGRIVDGDPPEFGRTAGKAKAAMSIPSCGDYRGDRRLTAPLAGAS